MKLHVHVSIIIVLVAVRIDHAGNSRCWVHCLNKTLLGVIQYQHINYCVMCTK